MKPWQMTLECSVMRRLGIVWSYSARGLAVGLEVLNALREAESLRGKVGRTRAGEGGRSRRRRSVRTEVSKQYRDRL